MIIDLQKFNTVEQPYWEELEQFLDRHEQDPYRSMPFEEIKRLHYLYQRSAADLVKINTFSAEQNLKAYLENLVGRAYALIHGTRQKALRIAPVQWFWRSFPGTFRRRWKAFALSVAVMLLGCLFGGAAIVIDPEAKAVLLPYSHLQIDPAERVAREERKTEDRLDKGKGRFSAFLMTHNTQVSITVLALGMTWGIGTLLVLFTNGVLLGAVAADYIRAGQSKFLVGWLLPHGAVEIPSILIAGQAGFLLAAALIGHTSAQPIGDRLRKVIPDVVNLITGVAVLLIWAGIVEAFFSQYHEPVLPYVFKIAFGSVELCLLALFFTYAGRGTGRKGHKGAGRK